LPILKLPAELKFLNHELTEKIREAIAASPGGIVIIPHENPDGDAIGSVTGLGRVLRNAGHQATVITPNDYPGFLKWLNNLVEIYPYSADKERAALLIKESRIIFCLDFNDPGRAGSLRKLIESSGALKILIDHHPEPSGFCDITLSDTSCSSTAEMVYDFLIGIGYGKFMDEAAVEAIFTGIMTDTGSFSYGISNPNTFRVLSELVAYRINPDKIHRNVYDNYSGDRMRLLGYCLSEKMVILHEYRTAYISLSRDEQKKYNFVPGDSEGFVNYPLSVSNIIFSALFIEKEDYVKVSLRSKGDFAVNAVCAAHFKGGGHRNAAGGESTLSLEQTINQFRQLLPSFLHQLNCVTFD